MVNLVPDTTTVQDLVAAYEIQYGKVGDRSCIFVYPGLPEAGKRGNKKKPVDKKSIAQPKDYHIRVRECTLSMSEWRAKWGEDGTERVCTLLYWECSPFTDKTESLACPFIEETRAY